MTIEQTNDNEAQWFADFLSCYCGNAVQTGAFRAALRENSPDLRERAQEALGHVDWQDVPAEEKKRAEAFASGKPPDNKPKRKQTMTAAAMIAQKERAKKPRKAESAKTSETIYSLGVPVSLKAFLVKQKADNVRDCLLRWQQNVEAVTTTE